MERQTTSQGIIAKRVRFAGLPISIGDDVKTNQRSAVYRMDEFRACAGDLITQDGVSIIAACQEAGYAQSMSYYNAINPVNPEGTAGLVVLKNILNAIGFEVEFLVHVRKLATKADGKFVTLDPEMTRAYNFREAFANKTLVRRYGKHHTKARKLLFRK